MTDSQLRPTHRKRWLPIRGQISLLASIVLSSASVMLVFGVWWLVTRGEVVEERIVGPFALPSPSETFGAFSDLWFEQQLTRNLLTTLRRVILGFSLAAAVGVPLGVLAGCFPPFKAMLAPVILFGRNIPIAALVPLTYFFFGIAETQKVMFIFLACAAFVIADTTTSISNVSQRYLDTAYTLGSNRWQAITKVLVPLAMPSLLDSLRLLFGLAFGYIMLAESIKLGGESGGLGNLINAAQKRGLRTQIYLIILIIPIVAFLIDRFLFAIQKGLFPHKYGGNGWLLSIVREITHRLGDLTAKFWGPVPPFDQLQINSLSPQAAPHVGLLETSIEDRIDDE